MSTSELAIIASSVENLFIQEDDYESSEDPPSEEWSSLLLLFIHNENYKKLLAAQGLYDPGSGEICAKYVKQSDSSILRHPYYKFPPIQDPGINEALNGPIPQVTYEDDGMALYLDLCEEMNEVPCRMFYKQMLNENCNLKYYGISTYGLRPICMSLLKNKFVKFLDLTDNHLSNDGCYHLGILIRDSKTLEGVNLYGCKIGHEGARHLLYYLHLNRNFKFLNLANNDLGDQSMEYLSKAIYMGSALAYLNLSYNNISGKGVMVLSSAFDMNNELTHLDLSWNVIVLPRAVKELCLRLSTNEKLEYVNLAWNSMNARYAAALKYLFLVPNIKHLDLSYNRLCDEAIKEFARSLRFAKKLETLDLSSNPLTFQDSRLLCSYMRFRRIKLKNLLLEHVTVNDSFMAMRKRVLIYKFRQNATITHGYVRSTYVPEPYDMRVLVLRRMILLCSKPRKKAVNIPLLLLKVAKGCNNKPINAKELYRKLKEQRAFQINADLVEGLCDAFPFPKKGKTKFASLELLVEYINRKWPNVKLAP